VDKQTATTAPAKILVEKQVSDLVHAWEQMPDSLWKNADLFHKTQRNPEGNRR